MVEPIPEAMKAAMRGVTWHQSLPCPPLEGLRLVHVPFVDFAGTARVGQLVTEASLAAPIMGIFEALQSLHFPIQSVRPMIDFDGDDGRSMSANNSSCFNARRILNSDRLSMHSYGRAIDINPIQNPVIRDGKLRPDEGAAYADRETLRPGMITDGSAALRVFRDAGWLWGGHWDNPKDYHHFYLPHANDDR